MHDILIACIDGLKGFVEAIAAVFPMTEIQTYVFQQDRNSLRYIAEKNKKPLRWPKNRIEGAK